MKVSFAADYPTFGTKNNRSAPSYQQKSPYYWWWAYLRCNNDYLNCCEGNGTGRLADLYKDFGDVRDDFYTWWTVNERGPRLFGEHYVMSVKELKDKSEWSDDWNANDVLVIAFPLTSNKRYLQSTFAKILKRVHTSKRGRTKNSWIKSNAKYKINRNFTIDSLRIAYLVYCEYCENLKRNKSDKLTLWEMGEKLRLVPTAMPTKGDTHEDNVIKRNRMAVSVNRYIQQAKKIIDGTAVGIFPA